jgi:hypothetical protein
VPKTPHLEDVVMDEEEKDIKKKTKDRNGLQ